MGLKEWLVPQDRVFYDLLERESDNVLVAAVKLQAAFRDLGTIAESRTELKDLEHQGDDLVSEIYRKMHETLITPIDRQDMARLASLYDDVLDYIYAVANRVFLYRLREPTDAMLSFATMILACVSELQQVFKSMRRLDKDEIDKHLFEIDLLEKQADSLLDESVAALLDEEDLLRIMKLKEIYEYLETVTDRCEDLGWALRDMLLKHS